MFFKVAFSFSKYINDILKMYLRILKLRLTLMLHSNTCFIETGKETEF